MSCAVHLPGRTFYTLASIICVHIWRLQRNIPRILCTNHPISRGWWGGGWMLCLLTLTFLPPFPCPQGHIFHPQIPHHRPQLQTSLLTLPGQVASETAQCPPQVWAPPALPSVAFGHRLEGVGGRRGKGGSGPSLMQSRDSGGQGGCPLGGWSAAACAPAPSHWAGTIRAGSGSLLGLRRTLRQGGFT